MKLSTKSRYAVTAMLGLAAKGHDSPMTLSDISECQGISTSYFEQLFSMLRKAKLVEGVRGPGGGYRLGKSADKISIAQIVSAVDQPIDSALGKGTADDRSITHRLWEDLSVRLYEFLDEIMLTDLIKPPKLKRFSIQNNSTSSRINRMFQPVV